MLTCLVILCVVDALNLGINAARLWFAKRHQDHIDLTRVI
jgi:hypothetical protein